MSFKHTGLQLVTKDTDYWLLLQSIARAGVMALSTLQPLVTVNLTRAWFLFLIYIIRAEHSHLIRQLAQASTDTQSYSCLCSIPQRQCCEDARYKEPYAWQRLNYHQAFTKQRECTIS